MELPTITPPPVPIPQRATVRAFQKSLLILIMAYIQIGFYVLFIFRGVFERVFFDGGTFGFMGSFLSSNILFLIPALVVVFSKNQLAYRIARIFLIVEYVVIIGVMILLISLFSGGIGGW